jgi:LacI family transcriptional regulator
MADIHDVARLAEVSTGTVSRVINGRPNVRPATRKAVLTAIAQLGYRPNPLGRNLRRARTTTLAMVVPNLTNPSFVQMISGAEAAAFDCGYTLVLALSHDDPDLEAGEITRMLDLRVDGLLCVPVESQDAVVRLLHEANVPGGVIGGRPSPSSPGRIVGTGQIPSSASSASYEAAFGQMMKDFVDFGHSRIGLLTTSQPFAAAERRIATYKAELQRAGIAYDASLVRVVKTEPDAREALREMLTLSTRVTALICGTLGVAPFALRAAHDLDLLVPDDVSFVTLGDAEWLEAYQPGLNALWVDTHGVAKATTLRLIHMIEGEEADESFEPTWNYLRRGSAAPAPSEGKSKPAST